MSGRYRYRSPAGMLTVSTEHGRVTAIDFGADPALVSLPESSELRLAFDAYFKDGVALDRDLYRLSASGFTAAVLEAAAAIPFGEVRTYRQVAAQAGSPRAFRAAGNALGANPIPVMVPCHRVIGTSGPGGYKGGLPFKRFLLILEGAISP